MSYTVWNENAARKTEIGNALLAEASSLTRAIDLRIATTIAAVQALSNSTYFDDDNLPQVYIAAKRTIEDQHGTLLNLALFDSNGHQHFNTLRAYGESLSNAYEQERVASATEDGLPRTSSRWIREAFSKGKPVVSDLFIGLTAKRPVISVHVPVLRNGRVLYVWSCNFQPTALASLLESQAHNRQWIAALVDRNQRIVARYPRHEEYFGSLASPAFRRSIGADERAVTEGMTLDGIKTYRAHVPTDYGWSLAVAVPHSTVTDMLRAHTGAWASAAVIALLAALVIVLWFAREVASPLRRLSDSAAGIAEGRLPQISTHIIEIDTLRNELVHAARARNVEVRLALLEALIQHAPIAIALFNPELRFVQVNTQVSLINGVSVSDHTEKPVRDVLGPLGETIEPFLMQARDSGEPVYAKEIHGEMRTAPGRKRWWIAEFFPLTDAEGIVTHVAAIASEITDRKESELAAHKAQEETRYLVENTPLAVVECDHQYIVTRWSARAEQMFGWSAEEVIGRPLAELPLMYEDDSPQVVEGMRKLAEPGAKYGFLASRNRTKDHRVLHCEWYNSVLRDDADKTVAVFSLVLDVTERKIAEAKLVNADRSKDMYLATLAHELRNPLAPVRNAVEILRQKGAPNAEAAWAREVIARQTTHMSRLLDDLLEVSRITQGKLQLRLERFPLAAALQDALEICDSAMKAAKHDVRIHVPESTVWVDGDRTRLAQAFSNVLHNAAKYTPPGGKVELRLCVKDGAAIVSVKDTGIGIAPESLATVLEPFVQTEEALQFAKGGLGIGLALVRGIAELHGGQAIVHSEGIGRGSQIDVVLPIVPFQVEGSLSSQSGERMAALTQTVLIADDNRDAADTLTALLTAAGATVTCCYDGRHALQLALANTPDVVVLDIGMPEMDGYEVARQLSMLANRPYLIAVSGWGQETDREAANAAGFDKHFTKPLEPSELIRVIAAMHGHIKRGK